MIKNVFLSYAREDSAAVGEIRAGLEGAGHDVWLDTADVVGGEQWRAAIVEAIDDSDVVVVVLSRHSTVSGAVRTEVDIASEAQKQIVPIMLDGEKPTGALRWNISGLQVIDMSSGRQDGMQALLAALDSARPQSPAPPKSKKTWHKWAALPIAVLVGLILVLIWPDPQDDFIPPITGATTTTTSGATTATTTEATTTTVEPLLIEGVLTLTNDFLPGGRSLADMDRGITYQVDVSTSLAHYNEIDVALYQSVELLIYGGVSDPVSGRGEPRFVIQSRNKPERSECDEALEAARVEGNLNDILLYSDINLGEWVCLLTTEGRIGAFRVAEEYDGSQLMLDYIVWE